jgi:hypothetical protein
VESEVDAADKGGRGIGRSAGEVCQEHLIQQCRLALRREDFRVLDTS